MACFNSIVINAPIDEVWAKMKDFHDFSWAPNVITKCEAVGKKKVLKLVPNGYSMMFFMKR